MAYIILKQAASLSDLPTVASGDYLISALNDAPVEKDDSQNIIYRESWRRYTQQTTNNTPTVPSGAYVSVSEGQVVLVKLKGLGRIADLSAAVGVEVWGVFRRASGGNVTLVGSLQGTAQEDSGGTPAITLVADTVNQRVNAQVTGVTAETWNFQVDITGLVY